MTEHDELLRRIRSRALEEADELPPVASEQDLAEAEKQVGFALPPLLARVYREVANGGFGPEYTLFPLIGEGRTAVSAYGTECPRPPAEPSPHWPRGVLPILDWGCGMYAAVDCLQPAAPVLVFEPNSIEDNWPDAWFQDAPSLAAWLNSWLHGTGWWEGEAMADGDAAEPRPWPQAAGRIAAGRSVTPSAATT